MTCTETRRHQNKVIRRPSEGSEALRSALVPTRIRKLDRTCAATPREGRRGERNAGQVSRNPEEEEKEKEEEEEEEEEERRGGRKFEQGSLKVSHEAIILSKPDTIKALQR
ncbi:hypothetical protein E2C01_037630 [Portunus trituberculatus]|uniref:Uncharacterized protein n=1 Tax=Portunus trituberculatus TaxID=210409 RepID=A0A5B7F8M1_PORTR|nr:hypothetical protein [Portunus trituberculatus]